MKVAEGRLLPLPDGEVAWQIDGLEAMGPFLISVVSPGDHWMYVSTSGGLTAGRRDATRCLFPYETDDRLHFAAGLTGPLTLIRAPGGALWQPFDPRGLAPGRRRTLRKAAMGHWLEFEEEAPDLGLTFRYRWTTSEQYGLVRRASLDGAGQVELLDGLLNVMPADVPPSAQQGLSALVDAYKRSERVGNAGLFALEALLSDRASPAEALRANVIWRRGLDGAQLCLSARVVDDFRAGRPTADRDLEFGARGAYLVRGTVSLPATWDLFGEVHLDQVELTALLRRSSLDLDADLAAGARALRANVASADGLQHTAEVGTAVHHFANVVFNNMRGGVFADAIDTEDLVDFVGERNRAVRDHHQAWLRALPPSLDHDALLAAAEATGDPQLVRLCLEYLPLTFSRRHGDPSRPWNSFSIQLRRPDGRPRYAYEGNWRDIFQNWEALARSFPAYLPAMIAKFLNATTLDGFNPYRLTRAGIDWEVPNPEDPWSNIGYWGDHQIVYLFRLLEAEEAHHPGSLRRWLGRDLFSSAAVPYRLRPYADLCRDAKDAIVFDTAAEHRSVRRVAELGGDGRLALAPDGRVLHLNLLEKLLICVLAKLSNFVADGGIWMNTQRPEWNDANNALVGQGLSVVTLAHLRRALVFLGSLVDGAGAAPISTEVAGWFEGVAAALSDEPAGDGMVSPAVRLRLMDRLGSAFSDYRAAIVERGAVVRAPFDTQRVVALGAVALRWLDRSLATNRRADGLFHSYNLLSFAPGEARVGRLYEMLEGQVAVMGSGWLGPAQAVLVIDAMFASALYREDQHSFLLYPFRDRPRLLDRNRVDPALVRATPLLASFARPDADGVYHFHPEFSNADLLAAALDRHGADPEARAAVLAVYEQVFDHLSFTGRSGTMYKYEGLGSIYWHMVSKLLLAVQEVWWAAHEAGDPAAGALAERYYRIRRGLSFNKSVAEYGAFPSDPYSHTPIHLGAQQPGMTGQVKEEILTRFGELGVRLQAGCLSFAPHLLRKRELTLAPAIWVHGRGSLEVPANAVAFTLAETPIVLAFGAAAPTLEVHWADGRVQHFGDALDAATTAAVLGRRGAITAVRAHLPESVLTLD